MHPGVVARIKALPHTPGVYLFKDASGQVMYIGKARDLKARCLSYLHPEAFDNKGQTIAEQAVDFETIDVTTDLAAMVLEAKLIQTHQPPLNVLLKRGQPFLFLLVTSEALPRLEMVRVKSRKGTYFGPFIDKKTIRSLYEFVTKTFQLRLCTRKVASGCLNYHMGHCAGRCKDDFDLDGYKERLEFVKTLLARGSKALLLELDQKIAYHSDLLEFETAQRLLGYRESVDAYMRGKSSVIEASRKSLIRAYAHVWVLCEDKLFVYREHKLTFKELSMFVVENPEESIDDYVQAFYEQHEPALTIITNASLDQQRLLVDFLKTWWHIEYEPSIITQPTDHNLHILNLALLKARDMYDRTAYAGKEIQEFLGLEREPKTIDCFDISHTQGNAIVGGAVRFVNGRADKSGCRRFIITSLDNQNDYAALQEVARRRYKHSSEYPDLLLIDGGKGQLSAVMAVLSDVECASIAKKEERIFSPRLSPEGKRLVQSSRAGKTLISLRDYVHHFAITFERKKFSERAKN